MSWTPKYGKLVRRTPDPVAPVPAEPHPLDHDANGQPGGSLPKAERKPRGRPRKVKATEQ